VKVASGPLEESGGANVDKASRMHASVASAVFAISSIALAPTPLPAAEAVPGNAVLARANGDALVVWDATTVIALIVKNRTNDATANDVLEHDAARVLAAIAPSVNKSVKTIGVQIVYSKTGDVSPVYGSATFQGVEDYATLTVTMAELRAHARAWKDLDPKSSLPASLAFKVTGHLPPR